MFNHFRLQIFNFLSELKRKQVQHFKCDKFQLEIFIIYR